MAKLPLGQTPKTLPPPLAMSTAPSMLSPAEPTPTEPTLAEPTSTESPSKEHDPAKPTPSPIPKKPVPDPPGSGFHDQHTDISKPKQRLEIRDLTHAGTAIFFQHLQPTSVLPACIATVLRILYAGNPNFPAVRSVTLVLRAMDGVAYTTGAELDGEHKEIHVALAYVAGVAPARRRDELLGMLVHEMVHVWQWDGRGAAPGGLIEGVADFVRLRAGLAPPHWRRGLEGEWDAGYAATGFFLAWLEERFGEGTVRRINQRLEERYEEDGFWKAVCGENVAELWRQYRKEKSGADDAASDGPSPGEAKSTEKQVEKASSKQAP